ncbi:MAG: 4Fe-4S binding protein [Aeromonas sp.]
MAEVPVAEFPGARPPWALREAQFLTQCTRCEACIKACPQGFLRPAPAFSADGLPTAYAGTPELDLSCGRCTYCAQCAKACPTGALDLTYGYKVQTCVEIDFECLAKQGRYCLLCENACPHGAIRAGSDGIEVQQALCDGCGACNVACIYGAIKITPHPQPKD